MSGIIRVARIKMVVKKRAFTLFNSTEFIHIKGKITIELSSYIVVGLERENYRTIWRLSARIEMAS